MAVPGLEDQKLLAVPLTSRAELTLFKAPDIKRLVKNCRKRSQVVLVAAETLPADVLMGEGRRAVLHEIAANQDHALVYVWPEPGYERTGSVGVCHMGLRASYRNDTCGVALDHADVALGAALVQMKQAGRQD